VWRWICSCLRLCPSFLPLSLPPFFFSFFLRLAPCCWLLCMLYMMWLLDEWRWTCDPRQFSWSTLTHNSPSKKEIHNITTPETHTFKRLYIYIYIYFVAYTYIHTYIHTYVYWWFMCIYFPYDRRGVLIPHVHGHRLVCLFVCIFYGLGSHFWLYIALPAPVRGHCCTWPLAHLSWHVQDLVSWTNSMGENDLT
jgi:hypothetical protein